LDAYGNEIKTIPETIQFCHNLCNLRLNENTITKLPEQIGKLTSLITIDVSYNEISSLPLSFFNLTQLKELYLSGNQLEVPFDILSRFSHSPVTLLENIRDYQKNLSEKLAKDEKNKQEEKIKTLTQHQLAEQIVIKMSHYKTTVQGMEFHLRWKVKNNLTQISKQLSAFDRRISDICCLHFCLTETMTSGEMNRVIESTKKTPTDYNKAAKSSLISQLRSITRDNDLSHDAQIKAIYFEQTLNLEASFKQPEECEKYVSLWLVLTEMLAEKEIELNSENLPVLSATINHVIASNLHEPDLAAQLANGFLILLANESLE
jgi:Leucine-rich repeat (LRR) protein